MGLSIQDLLSGDIVKPRQALPEGSHALGQMLAFLSQGQSQAPALPAQPNYAEIYKDTEAEKIARAKQKAHLDAIEQMKSLIGNTGSAGNGIPVPYRDAVLPTAGAGYLGGNIDRNELATRMMGLDDTNLQAAGMGIFEKLIPTATKAGIGVIPSGSKHEQDPDTGTWWWRTPQGDLVRDMSAMTENQSYLQDPKQVKEIATAKIGPTIQEATMSSGNKQKMTAEELLSLREGAAETRRTATEQLNSGSIDKPMYDTMMNEANKMDPSGQTTYDEKLSGLRATSDEQKRLGAMDLPVIKNDIESTRSDIIQAIQDLKTTGGQKQILPGVNRWFDANVKPDIEANRATRIAGSKVLETLKAIGGNDSNADLQFGQIISGLDPYSTDKDTLLKNYNKLLTGLDYKEKVLENKFGGYTPNAPIINSNAPQETNFTSPVENKPISDNPKDYPNYTAYKNRKK